MAPNDDKKPPVITKHQRGAAKAKVTFSINKLKIAIEERGTKASEIESLLTEIKIAHTECIDVCQEFNSQADELENIDANMEYVSEISAQYISTLKEANKCLDAMASPNPTQTQGLGAQSPLEQKFEKMCDLLSMPETPLDVFDGQSPLEFHDWWYVFVERVDGKAVSDMVKLNKLLHATDGVAYDLIKHCKSLGGTEGYKTAKTILHETFDDPDAITRSILQNLMSGERAATGAELTQLAADLRSAASILTKHDRVTELQSQDAIKNIVKKRLPKEAIIEWRQITLKSKFGDKGNNTFKQFQEFIAYVVRLSKMKRCKTWGDLDELLSDCRHPTDSMGASCNNAATLQLKNQRQQFCCLCNMTDHIIFSCERFRAMQPVERKAWAMSNGICFRCVSGKHQANACPWSKYKCDICEGPHSKFLHIQVTEDPRQEIENPEHMNQGEMRQGEEDPLATKMCMSSGPYGKRCMSDVLLPLVPIKINGLGVEYVLLDRGSQVSSIEESLVDELRLAKQPRNAVVQGMWSSGQVNSMVDFNVCSVQNGNSIDMRNIIVVPKIAARHPKKQVDLRKYPYLNGLPLLTGEEPRARMIIGQDNAHLLVSYETRCGPDIMENALFAERTYLGWALQGPMCDNSSFLNDSTENSQQLYCNNCNLKAQDDIKQPVGVQVSDAIIDDNVKILIDSQDIVTQEMPVNKLLEVSIDDSTLNDGSVKDLTGVCTMGCALFGNKTVILMFQILLLIFSVLICSHGLLMQPHTTFDKVTEVVGQGHTLVAPSGSGATMLGYYRSCIRGIHMPELQLFYMEGYSQETEVNIACDSVNCVLYACFSGIGVFEPWMTTTARMVTVHGSTFRFFRGPRKVLLYFDCFRDHGNSGLLSKGRLLLKGKGCKWCEFKCSVWRRPLCMHKGEWMVVKDISALVVKRWFLHDIGRFSCRLLLDCMANLVFTRTSRFSLPGIAGWDE